MAHDHDAWLPLKPQIPHMFLMLGWMKSLSEILQWLCNQPGIDPNVKAKRDQVTPLIDAMTEEKFEYVEMLLATKGIDINSTNFRNDTPLIVATGMRNIKLVQMLLKAGADYTITSPSHGQTRVSTRHGRSPLMVAVGCGEDIVQEYLHAGVPLDFVNTDGEGALSTAVREGSVEIVDLLVRAGANCQANPQLPALVLAANIGDIKLVHYLLSSGQDPNLKDGKGWSSLHYACAHGDAGTDLIIDWLLKKGADINARTRSGSTGLALAVFNRNFAIAEALVACDCDVNLTDADGESPLHFAAAYGHTEMAKILLDHEAKVCLPNRVGATPLFNAVVSGNPETVKLLLPFYVPVDLNVSSRGFSYETWEDRSELWFPEPRSVLYAAATHDSLEFLSLLQIGGCDASREEWIHDGEFPENAGSDVRDVLRAMASSPRSLMLLCRMAVRSTFGHGGQRKVTGMYKIPRKLRNYISLRDL